MSEKPETVLLLVEDDEVDVLFAERAFETADANICTQHASTAEEVLTMLKSVGLGSFGRSSVRAGLEPW